MEKSLYIAEKPSVAREFAKALKLNMKNRDGYLESEEAIVTWCVGHLVTMSYPEAYDEKYKRWSLDTIPFIPEEFKYEVIGGVKKQFQIVSGLLNRKDVATIYVCTDSGREGEYIYRLVERQAGVSGKVRKRVWIDSQTEEEILRGIREAKDLSEYDNLGSAAYLRAKEDYLMGINFSRVLTLKYSYPIKSYLKTDRAVVSVGRVMTCVLGMAVNREREIRSFVKTPFYRIIASVGLPCGRDIEGEWRAVEGSAYYQSPLLYKENGFLKEEDAKKLIERLSQAEDGAKGAFIASVERKKEVKNAPLLYNLAELQNECSKFFKISPDETLRIVQELYEKKMVTYPRTDARVLSTAVAKEIHKNIRGLCGYAQTGELAGEALKAGSFQGIAKTRYVNDKQITDHYAIIPTGQGLNNLAGLSVTAQRVYEIIARRFLSIFFPPAIYQKIAVVTQVKEEKFFSSFKVLAEEGYLRVLHFSFSRKTDGIPGNPGKTVPQPAGAEAVDTAGKEEEQKENEGGGPEPKCDAAMMEALAGLKKGMSVTIREYAIKEGETSPPKRYNSGSMILTMENAGQFIEDDDLRAQIKGSGIGTSATRAEILKKLVNNNYLALNKKTQIITPTLLGEMIYDVVKASIKPLLDPALTASWEKGLMLVAEGSISEQEYMAKLDDFVTRRTNIVKQTGGNTAYLYREFDAAARFYRKD